MIETVPDALVVVSHRRLVQVGMNLARALGGEHFGRRAVAKMQKQLSQNKIPRGFRPFAPSVLRESVNEWFELDSDSPTCLWSLL